MKTIWDGKYFTLVFDSGMKLVLDANQVKEFEEWVLNKVEIGCREMLKKCEVEK